MCFVVLVKGEIRVLARAMKVRRGSALKEILSKMKFCSKWEMVKECVLSGIVNDRSGGSI